MKKCSVPECTKPVRARGWCATHYRRWQIHGDVNVVLSGGRERWGDPDQRIWTLIDKEGHNGCWRWIGAINTPKRGGYGIYRGRYAHRIIWEKLKGPIPTGMVLDHVICRTHWCVNPEHLRITTRGLNADANRRKTHCPQGHPYDDANTYRNAKGSRICRACNRERYHRAVCAGTMPIDAAQRKILADWGAK